MKSTFLNMVLVLFAISVVAAGAVGGVNMLTKSTIEAAAKEAEVASLAAVLPQFDNDPMTSAEEVTQEGTTLTIYSAKQGDEAVGYAVKTQANGFSGAIELMVGFATNGEIVNIVVLSQSETPGLGAKIADEGNPVKVSFVGKNVADLKLAVRKDGGDIEAITASTISSRAYTEAVKRAYDALVEKGVLGASTQVIEEPTPAITETENGYDIAVSGKGFNGDISIVVSFEKSLIIRDIVVAAHSEDRPMSVFDKLRDQLIGKNVNDIKMSVKAEGGDIDAISGATVSSNGYLMAVRKAFEALNLFLNPSCNE